MIYKGLKSARSHCPDSWWAKVAPYGSKAVQDFERWCYRLEREFLPQPQEPELKEAWFLEVARSLKPYQQTYWCQIALELFCRKYKAPRRKIKAVLKGART